MVSLRVCGAPLTSSGRPIASQLREAMLTILHPQLQMSPISAATCDISSLYRLLQWLITILPPLIWSIVSQTGCEQFVLVRQVCSLRTPTVLTSSRSLLPFYNRHYPQSCSMSPESKRLCLSIRSPGQVSVGCGRRQRPPSNPSGATQLAAQLPGARLSPNHHQQEKLAADDADETTSRPVVELGRTHVSFQSTISNIPPECTCTWKYYRSWITSI